MATVTVNSLKFDEHGLIPAVVQDAGTGAVLMVAYMNAESYWKTVQTGETHFWSRSRGELWHKGESSGNRQIVRRMTLDCDSDALLLQVEQLGNACHTGAYSCFFTPVFDSGEPVGSFSQVVSSLAEVIHKRKVENPKGSYSAELFNGGIDKILKKVGEEAGEVIIAAKNHEKKEIAWEVADLVYHLLVMLEQEGVSLGDIAAELVGRAGQKRKDA